MSTIVTRAGKGTPLTNAEVDANFTNLNTDKMAKSANLSDVVSVATAKVNLGLNNVNNTADVDKPVSTATQAVLDTKTPLIRTVNGHALTTDVTITKSDVGLGNADNTTDLNKPVSTATQAAITDAVVASSTAAQDANNTLAAAIQTSLDAKVPLTRSVNGHALSADVTVTKGDVGLGNADNTSDANKPVSTAQAAADTAVLNAAATDATTKANARGDVSLAAVQTLTNKTIALGSNTVSGTLAQLNAAVTDADLVSLAGAETLTNKTIVVANNTLTTAASGNLTSTTLNAALAELQSDIDTRATSASPSFTGPVLAVSPTGGLGYGTGAGGAVTQITSRTTGVTLSKASGAITLFTAVGATAAASFIVTNTVVGVNDTISLSVKSATNKYIVLVTAVNAGSFEITFYTTGGVVSDTPVINFNVIKGVAA